MYTLCPHCSTCFRITSEQVNVAQGNVRCGNCGAVFNALDHPGPEPDSFTDSAFAETEPLLDELYKQADDELHRKEEITNQSANHPNDLFGEPNFIPLGENKRNTGDRKPDFIPLGENKTNDRESTPPVDDSDWQTLFGSNDSPRTDKQPISRQQQKATAEDPREHFFEEVENTTIEELEKLLVPDKSPGTETTPEHEPATTISDTTPKLPIQKIKTLLVLPPFFNQVALSTASLLLIVLLLGQYIYFARDHLAQQYPSSRPLLESMCGYLGCKLPLQRDLNKLQLTNRDVRSHPVTGDALLINATFINNATFPQPYPVIELKLSSINGRLIGRRFFQPKEYVAGDPDISAGIPPNTQVHLILELADPGKQAVNFEFDFRQGAV